MITNNETMLRKQCAGIMRQIWSNHGESLGRKVLFNEYRHYAVQAGFITVIVTAAIVVLTAGLYMRIISLATKLTFCDQGG